MSRRALIAFALALAACRSGLIDPECDAARPCAESADPCQVAYCTYAGECAQKPALDGTHCGLSDCITAHACRGGVCAKVPATEGEMCAPATPCRDAATCVMGQCRTPPSRAMATPIWEIPPSRPGALLTPISVDDQGNFYWQECPDALACADAKLVSVGSAGERRLDLRVSGASMLMIVGDSVMRSGGCFREGAVVRGAFIESRSTKDGALRWSLDATTLLPPAPGTSCQNAAKQLAFDGDKTIYAILGITPTTNVAGSVKAISLDATSGAVHWFRDYPGYWNWIGGFELVGDGRDGFAFRAGNESIALDANGGERFRAPSLYFPVAAEGGRLWDIASRTGDGKWHYVYQAWGSTGRRAYELGPRQVSPLPSVAPIFAGDAGYAFDAGNAPGGGEALVGFDSATGQERWRTPIAVGGNIAAATDIVLTNRESLLFVESTYSVCDDMKCNWSAAYLAETSTHGAPQWACELPLEQYDYGTRGAQGTIALGRGVVAIIGGDQVVRGYAVPGAEPGSGDWTAAWGSVRPGPRRKSVPLSAKGTAPRSVGQNS